MTHYKTLLDPSIFVGPQDFPSDKTVQIARVVRESMPERNGEKAQSSPMLYFSYAGKELPRKYKVPKSVLYGLSLTYGTDIDGWVGKDVTLYAAQCLAFGEVEECVRIRFTPEVEAKIFTWLKKRKANKSAYLYRPNTNHESVPA